MKHQAEEYKTWLSELKVGDHVTIMEYTTSIVARYVKIEKLTKTQVVTDFRNMRFKRIDGIVAKGVVKRWIVPDSD